MQVAKYFGLAKRPFETKPDARFYFASDSHAEALATMEYAVREAKPCTVVLGESGSGKTLLAEMLVRKIGRQRGVLWVHGFGQPEGDTAVTLCPPGSTVGQHAFHPRRVKETTLSRWIRAGLPVARAAVLLVDNADGLTDRNWQDLIALVTREIRTQRPLTLILLGLPTLDETLQRADLVRLRRRVFRTTYLSRMTAESVRNYINHRLHQAGSGRLGVFTNAAIELVHRFSNGNPGLVNQLCDNALIDAFGEDRTRIDAKHVIETVHSITGGAQEQRPALPMSGAPRIVSAVTPVVMDDRGLEARLNRLRENVAAFSGQPALSTTVDAETLERSTSEVGVEAEAGDSNIPAQPAGPAEQDSAKPFDPPPIIPSQRVTAEIADDAEEGFEDDFDDDIDEMPIDERLKSLERRLSSALDKVREAREVPQFPSPEANGNGDADEPAVSSNTVDEPES